MNFEVIDNSFQVLVLLGMALAHHKTRKPKFYITVPLLLALQIGLILYLYR